MRVQTRIRNSHFNEIDPEHHQPSATQGQSLLSQSGVTGYFFFFFVCTANGAMIAAARAAMVLGPPVKCHHLQCMLWPWVVVANVEGDIILEADRNECTWSLTRMQTVKQAWAAKIHVDSYP